MYRLFLFVPLFFLSCMKGIKVDLVVYNARIHVMDDNNTIAQAMAIRDGKIIEVGPERQILNKYSYDEEIDAGGRDVFPGFTDAHGHLFSYAAQRLTVDLTGSKSMEEIMVRCEKFAGRNDSKFLIGRGWDQAVWNSNELPDKTLLDKVFPTIPVCLYRVDGHAVLVNSVLLKKAKIDANTRVDGGEILMNENEPTGILVDNAIQLVEPFLPKPSDKKIEKEMEAIQRELLQYGITGVHEAGVTHHQLRLLQKWCKKKTWNIDVYAMLMDESANREFAKKGPYFQRHLTVRSFKVFTDGALGSRGALLKKPYSDATHTHGLKLVTTENLEDLATFCLKHNYQMNAHAIGDSANRLLLKICERVFKTNADHRFRIEHAQVVDPIDFKLFSDYAVFPSVQPTHAVSDMRWAANRIGKERLAGAYAYQTLLNQYGMIALGTDFPVEAINPFLTIHAAVHRKNADGQPIDGFLPKEKLTLTQTLKGMTIWPAFAAFEEGKKGTLEKGKVATFAIFVKPVNAPEAFVPNFAWKTIVKGKVVYAADELVK